MGLKPCSSCDRLVRADGACPFCGAAGPPTTFAPSIAAVVLSLPLLAAAACTRPAESIYGGPEMVDPAPSATESTTPVPEKPAEADPPEPSEPQGEIYGSPQMMDPSDDEPDVRAVPDEPDETDPPEPAEPIYGGPDMDDEPGVLPDPPKRQRRRRGR